MPVITPMPMSEILTGVGTVATTIFSALGSAVGTITSTPLLLVVLLLGLTPLVIKIGIRLFKQLKGASKR